MPTTPLRSPGSATVPLQSAGSATVPADGMTPEHNVLVVVVDDAAREYLKTYDQTTYNPASPGSRVDPVSPAWTANQWTEAAQDDSTFPYPPMPTFHDLAVNGLVCTRFHTAAMCSPTRASLLTGRNTIQHGLGNAILQTAPNDPFGNPIEFLGDTIYALMEAQGSGYVRAHFGKWHISESLYERDDLADSTDILTRPITRGRANFFAGHVGNMAVRPVTGYSDVGGDHTEYVWTRYDARSNPRPFDTAPTSPFYPATGVTSDSWWRTDQNVLISCEEAAIDVIENAAADGEPFLMTFMTHAIHSPDSWDDIGGAALSATGHHSYGSSPPGGDATVSHPLNIKAFLESVDTSVGNVIDAMTTEQRANTMIVLISDNGSTSEMMTATATADTLESGKDAVPVSNYNTSHTKRSPWEGGIGGFCIINGPAVVSPGNGTVPRFWGGLCGVEDLFGLICQWTGTRHGGDARYDTTVMANGVKDTSAKGREVYAQRAFQLGYADDMFSDDQAGVRFWSVQNDDAWKLIWISTGGGSYPGDSYKLYNMADNPLEADTADPPTHNGDVFANATGATLQDKYGDLDSVESGAQAQFDQLYRVMEAEGKIPPGMEIVLA